MIGHSRTEFADRYWWPSQVPDVFETKQFFVIEQLTFTGRRSTVSTTPVLDETGAVVFGVCITEESCAQIDMDLTRGYVAQGIDEKETDAIQKTTGLVTENTQMQELLSVIDQAARSDVPILLQGESGTGKSMIAEYVHHSSPRNQGRFVSVNCAAIPEQLMESELLGYEPYAFTGADKKGKTGLFEMAHQGTLFGGYAEL